MIRQTAKGGAPELRRADEKARNLKLGLGFAIATVVLMALLAAKTQLMTALSSGDTITATFADSYKLKPHDSSVKVAGLVTGEVTKVSPQKDGTTKVTMKVDHHTFEALGSHPTARIEPRTILGGRYVVEIHKGGSGQFDGTIPLSATSEPVELDRVLEALPKDARTAVQGLVGEAGPTLKNSKATLHGLLTEAPKVMQPGTGVLTALEGTRPGQDLPALVSNLNATADALSRQKGQLASIAHDLNATAVTLAQHAGPLSQTLHTLPQTLASARAGLTGLDGSITRLETTARELRPSIPKVNTLVDRLDPVLEQAQPLLNDLQPLLQEARPTVDQLVPVADQAHSVLNDLHGPVLDRVNGPVASFVLNPWKGTGAYAGATDNYMKDQPFFKELAYMAVNIDRASMMQDSRGSTLGFQVGAAANSLDGLPFDLDSIVKLALDEAGVKDPAVRKAALIKAGVSQ